MTYISVNPPHGTPDFLYAASKVSVRGNIFTSVAVKWGRETLILHTNAFQSVNLYLARLAAVGRFLIGPKRQQRLTQAAVSA